MARYATVYTGSMKTEKACTKCGVTQPVSAFSKHKAKKDGLGSCCKACAKAYRVANKEHIVARHAAWNAANKEKKAATGAAWYEANKEKKAAASAAWGAANLEKAAASQHRRRARLALNGVNLVTAAETAAIIAQPCMACDAPAPSTVEHLVPVNRGGAHTIGNLAPLCQPCNSSKNDMLWIEWKHSNRAGAQKAFAA